MMFGSWTAMIGMRFIDAKVSTCAAMIFESVKGLISGFPSKGVPGTDILFIAPHWKVSSSRLKRICSAICSGVCSGAIGSNASRTSSPAFFAFSMVCLRCSGSILVSVPSSRRQQW